MVNPRTPPRNRAAWDDFAVLSGDEDFDTPPGVTRAERPELPASPLSPLSLNMGKTPTGGPGRRPPRNSNKRARSVDIHGHEEEEDEDEEAGASDESRVAQAPGALGPGALSHLPTNSPQKAGTRPARETVRRSNRPRPSVRYDGDGGDDDGDDGDWSLAEEESEHEKPTASKGKKRKKPTASTGKNRKKPTASTADKPRTIRHRYRPVDPRYAAMTTERLFNERHIATGSFAYNHPQFAKEAKEFNDFKVNGKPVWQKQPPGPSTLHNSIVLRDRFPSLAPFLGPLEGLCKPRPTTNRSFLKQRAQQYEKSGRRHRDGKNGPWRICITTHDPAAPANTKQLEIGVADASKAKGGGALNPFQLKADGTPDSRRFDCPSGSYHLMDEGGEECTCVGHAHKSNASVGGKL
eukprot:g16139.t1